jgi:hypothetical protein
MRVLIDLAGAGAADGGVPRLLGELAEHCVRLLPVDSCAVLLADHDGELGLAAAAPGQARVLGLIEVGSGRGPAVDAYRTADAVLCDDLGAAGDRWAELAPAALALDARCVVALPLRRRGRRLGALGLYRSAVGPLPEESLELARALAELAAIGILRTLATGRRARIAVQWGEALEHRIVVQQAVGILSERLRLPVGGAQNLLAELADAEGVDQPELARRLVRDPSAAGLPG